MWLILIILIVALYFGVTQMGLIPPAHAIVIIQIRAGKIRVTRGLVKTHAKEHVADILADANVTLGFIAITPGKRVTFSRHIPKSIQQQLRNVLLNQ